MPTFEQAAISRVHHGSRRADFQLKDSIGFCDLHEAPSGGQFLAPCAGRGNEYFGKILSNSDWRNLAAAPSTEVVRTKGRFTKES
jgi:hypothetical protein